MKRRDLQALLIRFGLTTGDIRIHLEHARSSGASKSRRGDRESLARRFNVDEEIAAGWISLLDEEVRT